MPPTPENRPAPRSPRAPAPAAGSLRRALSFVPWLVAATFVAAVVHQVVRLVTGSGSPVLVVQAGGGIALLALPRALRRWTSYVVPAGLDALYAVFLFMALNLGSVYNAYDALPEWDTMLHAFSAGLIVLFALGLWRGAVPWHPDAAASRPDAGVPDARLPDRALIRTPTHPGAYPAATGALFGLSFAALAGVAWELFEWGIDALMPLQNSQRFLTSDKVPLVGREALADTMGDLITNTAGSLVAAIVVYFALRQRAAWLDLLVPGSQRASG